MLSLFHAPESRSSRVVTLLDELGARDRVVIEIVGIRRARSGTGAPDPRNPHPEGKVPLLVHDGVTIRETNAIMLYLTDLFPEAGLGVPAGDPQRGAYLSWLAWYGNVMEPALILDMMGISHPSTVATFRTSREAADRLAEALAGGPFLMGDRFTAADLICHSPYAWFRDAAPDLPVIRDWIARCEGRPATARTKAWDAGLMAQAAA